MRLSWTASDASWVWSGAFRKPETPTDAEHGAIVSASDSWAHLLKEVSAAATTAALEWSLPCALCEPQWVSVIDFLVLIADSAEFGESPVAVWMAVLGVSVAPASWQYTASEIRSDRGEFSFTHQGGFFPFGGPAGLAGL